MQRLRMLVENFKFYLQGIQLLVWLELQLNPKKLTIKTEQASGEEVRSRPDSKTGRKSSPKAELRAFSYYYFCEFLLKDTMTTKNRGFSHEHLK